MTDPAYCLFGKFGNAMNRLIGGSLPADPQFSGRFSPGEDLGFRVAGAVAAVSRLWIEEMFLLPGLRDFRGATVPRPFPVPFPMQPGALAAQSTQLGPQLTADDREIKGSLLCQ
jgi:hypothetical protein